jgi:hypothetical protein
MSAPAKDPQLSIGTMATTVTFEPDVITASPPPAAIGGAGDDVARLRALLRPIISDLLREELRTGMRMRG